jgi:hypothetical protein
MKQKVQVYCICGGALNGVIEAANAPEKANEATRLFWSVHSGAGHGTCDAKTAANARRAEERREAKRARAAS